MSQSKSLVIPFIILAVLIFGGALAWKTLSDKPEPATVKPQAAVVKKAPAKVVKPIERPEKPTVERGIPLTKEEYAAQRQEDRRLMRMAMKYFTPEAVVKDIEYFQGQNDQEKVDELIEYLVSTYPDYKLPKSLGK